MRQPLHALLLYLSALERRVHDAEARDVLSKADRAAQSLAGMIEGLIQLARLDAGKIDPELERVSLQSLFDDLLARAPRASAEATPLYVHSDPVLLETIMQQLISNAATHGGGNRLSASEEKTALRRSAKTAVRVSRRRIKSGSLPNWSAQAAAMALGVGLTIAKGLAELMKHTIEVRSAPGKGATFVVRAERA
ncbi:MAG: HAMP domain-containing histidine kinase [Caulobacteraceae bacterium]|nr:HAMP domain-containing histidine kinase [Caulobacteraceae bacterium]